MDEFSKLTAKGSRFEISKGEAIRTQGGNYGKFEYTKRVSETDFINLGFENIKDIIKVVNKAVKFILKSTGQTKVPEGTEFKVVNLSGTKSGPHGNTSKEVKRIKTQTISDELSNKYGRLRINSDKATVGKGNNIFIVADDKILKQLNGITELGFCHPQGCSKGETLLKIELKKV